jgi:hypothetical protein
MAITQAVANSFKKELLEGEHKFQFKFSSQHLQLQQRF